MRCLRIPLTGLLLFLATTGCGSGTATTPVAPNGGMTQVQSVPADPEFKTVSADSLPIGAYMAPLDEGRIELATPEGWTWLPRDSRYVTRFTREDRNPQMPWIHVNVEERILGSLETVTRDNVVEFTKLAAEEYKDKDILEPPYAMLLGEVPCARFVWRTTLTGLGPPIEAERQRLVVAKGGRLYTIDLLVRELEEEDRDAAYAVAASLRTPTAEEQPPLNHITDPE